MTPATTAPFGHALPSAAMIEEIVVATVGVATAIIAGVFSLVAVRMRRENTDAHNRGYGLLQSIDRRTENMDGKLDRHGEWIAGHDVLHSTLGKTAVAKSHSSQPTNST